MFTYIQLKLSGVQFAHFYFLSRLKLIVELLKRLSTDLGPSFAGRCC